MDYEIKCWLDEPLTPTLIHRALYVAVAEGTRYNAGEFPGHYLVIAGDGDDVNEWEDEAAGDKTEKLADIVDTFGRGDPSEDILSVDLSLNREPRIAYSLSALPKGDDCSLLRFKTHTSYTDGRAGFRNFLGLVETVCKRLETTYAAYRAEYQTVDPPLEETTTAAHLQYVTYLSPDRAAQLGREQLRSLPFEAVRPHDDGGMFLIVDFDPRPDNQALERIRAGIE